MTTPNPQPLPQDAVAVTSLHILTVNTHKGFSPLNRRFVLPELREAVRTLGADVVFLQEVLGMHRSHGQRYDSWSGVPPDAFLADRMWPVGADGRGAACPDGDRGVRDVLHLHRGVGRGDDLTITRCDISGDRARLG